MSIAIILARGGSKRIPRKNIKTFADKPMLAYAIQAANASGIFEHVIVSTDDNEIADIARQYGAETPFVRPSNLADDYTPTVPVVAHAIATCQSLGWKINFACCIYPCVPFVQPSDFLDALRLLKSSSADYCFPVAEFPAVIQRALKRGGDGLMHPFYPEHELSRTQDLETAYYDAGQFYWGAVNSWFEKTNLHSNSIGMPISNWRAVDIDTPDDWQRAEILFKSLKI